MAERRPYDPMTANPPGPSGPPDGPPDGNARKGRIVARSRADVDRAEREILDAVEAFGFERSATFAVRTAVEEAIVNAQTHGNLGDHSKSVTIEYEVDAESLVVVITDEGRGFDPAAVPDPTRPENVDLPSGRGIMLMRVYMSEVEFLGVGNRVRMVKRREG